MKPTNRIRLLLLLIPITNFCFAQTINSSLNLREKVTLEVIKENDRNTKKDTTYLKTPPNKLSFINQFDYLLNESLTSNYINAIFSSKNSSIQQFSKPIKIYIDPNIEKSLREEFIGYINDIPTIKNLSISFVNSLDDSNYYIKIANKNFNGISKKVLNKFTEAERKNLIFEKISRINFNDNNQNTYACLLTLSPSIFQDDNMMTKLKKAFFISLGNFNVLTYGAPNGSVLNIKTTQINRLNKDDILLLKMHYFHIYDFKVDFKIFKEIRKLKIKN
ncbi:hypothetical protein [Olleya sp. HaHaR_3_96]|uniref:hypothetical protein n=1 Tax=Olleya sp. HaHaR_3_96 TaxID=2745560 RepID=UPI001C4E6F7D|nr:hypothetical protein [Olleya sp. HaHaR_3_96]QXP59084.1 hypothetical protein H0I26_14315 [Olleya sp. HaHaR_3_96]